MSNTNKKGAKLSMKKIRDVLRHHFDLGLSNEQTAACVRISKGSVNNILFKYKRMNLTRDQLAALSDNDLRGLFYPKTNRTKQSDHLAPDFEVLAKERSKSNTTTQILYEEYRKENPDGIKRTQFFEEMKEVLTLRKVDLHLDHVGGEKLYLDYSGDRLPYFDKESGTILQAEIFVASWGASSKCYIEASRSQTKEDWIASNTRALTYFGGVPTYLVPDNLKSAVIKADFYDPDLNEAYRKMAEHYGTAILPARARKPKDKAVVEANVRAVQQRVFTRIRNESFGSFEELRDRLAEILEVFNGEAMQQHKLSRNQRFEELDRPHLKPLPKDKFDLLEVQLDVRVQSDHHVICHKHHYSVPWEWVGSKVEVWIREKTIEIYHDGQRLASHPRSHVEGKYTTLEDHRPPEHRFVRKLKPCFVLSEASEVGPDTLKAFRNIIHDHRGHCEIAVRKCLGILRLRKSFGDERLEQAISRSLTLACVKEPELRRILEQKLENSPLWAGAAPSPKPSNETTTSHHNLRGADHYNQFQGQST